MNNNDGWIEKATELRKRAEAMYGERAIPASENPKDIKPKKTQRLLHELQVHQIELEMQNEDLCQAQVEVDAMRQHYFDLYDLAPVGYVTVSASGSILEANLAAAGLLGDTLGALVNQPLSQFIHPDDQDLFNRHRRQLIENGEKQAWDMRMIQEDGTPLWVHLQAAVAEVAGGAPLFRVVMNDITEDHPVALSPQESEIRYQRITKAITDYIYTVRVTEGNATETIHGPGCIAVTGYDTNEFANDPYLWLQMVAPEDRPRVEEQARRILAGEAPLPIEHRIKHKSRTVRWVKNTFVAHRDERGALVSYDGVVVDITERKMAENALNQEKTFTRALLDNQIEGVVACDENGHLVLFNRTLVNWQGMDALELPQEQWAEHYDLFEADGTTPLATHAIPLVRAFNGEVIHDVGLVICAKNQPPRHVLCNGSPVLDEMNRRLGAVVVMHDITQQRENTDRLQNTLQRLELARTSASMGVWDWDIQSGCMTWDDRILELFGLTRGEFKGTEEAWKDGVHPEDLERAMAETEAALKGKAPFEMEFRVKHKDGTILWLKSNGLVLRDGKGSPLRIIGLNRDITERKEAEARLRESEEKFAKFFHLSPDAIDLTHMDTGVMVECNQNYLKMYGYAREELIGHSTLPGDLGIWVNKEERDRHISCMNEQREAFEFEATLRRKDGTILIGLISSSLVEIRGQRYNLSICRDISERKKAEKTLRESDAKNRALIDAIPDLIFTYSRAGEYLDISSPDKSLLLIPAEKVLNQNISDILPGPIAGQWLNAIGKALDLKAVQELEYLLLIAGKEKNFEARLAPSTNDKVVAIVRDITDRKHAEKKEHILQAKLQQSQKMESLGALVAGVAHNINNVLAIIMGTASFREQCAVEPSDLKAYKTIGRACARGRDVVRSLVQFAKPTISNQAPFELHMLIQELCALLGNTISNRIKIIEAFADEPLWFNGDAGTFSHALLNLSINAVDAMPNGGGLVFRTHILKENWVEVSVEDNGEGIAQDVLAKVMEPFFTTKDENKGTGLGLSMTYGVIKAHGGTIDIASQLGQGTTVKIRIPRIPAPVQVESSRAPMPTLGSLTVFLVDDDEDVRFLMGRMLKQAGVRQVKAFSCGEEVFESLRSGEFPDLIILDQNMPGMNGTQTMERIRELYPEVPILISSGQPDIEELADFKQPRVAVISKPFNMEEIQAKLAQFASAPIPGA